MKCGKLTAKLRDAIPVRFYENGREVKRYKNIEIPDVVKELEFQDFKFDVPLNGAITFKIFFDQGILPEVWPKARQRRTRGSKIAEAELAAENTDTDAPETPQDAADPVDEESAGEEPETNESAEEAFKAEDDLSTQETMEVRFDVTGSARKALAAAIGEYTGAYPSYQAAPSFAYLIGDYTLDRTGTLAGPKNDYLIRALAEDGYQTK